MRAQSRSAHRHELAFTLGAFSLALGSCAQPADVEQNPQTTSPATPLACPAEQLSCGKQAPIVAETGQVFVNEEMSITTRFEAGERVCLARSGDAMRGFYTFNGPAGTFCESPSPRGIGIGSFYNAVFARSLDLELEACGAPPMTEATMLARIGWPGRRFLTLLCYNHEQDGSEIWVIHALARPRSPKTVGQIQYSAHLQTDPAHREIDLERFRRFLLATQVGDEQVEWSD